MRFWMSVVLGGVLCSCAPLMMYDYEAARRQRQELYISLVGECLQEQSLSPVIDPNSLIGLLSGVEMVTAEGIMFLKASFMQSDKMYDAMFVLVRNADGDGAKAKVIYFSPAGKGVYFPSPQLFLDIFKRVPDLYPEVVRLQRAVVYISPDQEQPSLQRWTYFNQNGSIEVPVFVMPDGNGGSHFAIADQKQIDRKR